MRWNRAFTANPYPVDEGLGVIWRNFVGAKRTNPAGVGFTPRTTPLNDITPQLTLGLGGDVMSMFGRPLRFDASVRDFFAPCDHVVLNFEGVITDELQISPDQKHTPPILDALREVAEPARLVLGLSNNHTGDFGEKACRDCVVDLERQGFKTFGLCETPFIDLGDQLRVVTGTQWSNRE
ncbi:MAG TPA: CapA family protein, partial [Aquabacterium sp.]|nr:CapA family protein [Aquabacterium sp.]